MYIAQRPWQCVISILASKAIPLKHAIDVYLAEMIYAQEINAYCTLPNIVKMHTGGISSSDTASVPVYHTKIDDTVVYTARSETKCFFLITFGIYCDAIYYFLHFFCLSILHC